MKNKKKPFGQALVAALKEAEVEDELLALR